MMLLMTAVADGLATAACDFDVSVDGGAFQRAGTDIPGPAQFNLDSDANVIDIRATGHSAEFWPVQGQYQVTGPGSLTALATPDNFAPPLGTAFGPFGGVSVTVHLSRLRDATADCLSKLALVPANRTTRVPPGWPPPEWTTPEVPGIDYIDTEPLADSSLSTSYLTLDPQTTDIIFQRRASIAPQLFAVSWPDSVPIWVGAAPTPLLVYFHANMGQNYGDGYYHGPYPFDFDYLFYGLWNYLNYRDNPLTKWPFSLGLPYQIAASEKPLVLVLPCSSVDQEVGTFRKAADMELMLLEIQRSMFRRAGVYDPPPPIGRVALAGFSGATGLVAAFLNDPTNRSHGFFTNNLREIYGFDPPDNEVTGFAGALLTWLIGSQSPDAMARVYRQGSSSTLNALLPPGSVPDLGPFVVSSPDQRVTVGIIPAGTWQQAAATRGASGFGQQYTQVHHMFPSTLLTDALRRSGF